jgi:ABC-type branched-subunit amino acid transport system ATPase component
MPDLMLNHLTKRFGAVAAVRDISLAVREHEVLALVGPQRLLRWGLELGEQPV